MKEYLLANGGRVFPTYDEYKKSKYKPKFKELHSRKEILQK